MVVLGILLKEYGHIYQLDHIVEGWFSCLPLKQDKD